MPRAVSELTGSNPRLCIRVTEEQHTAYLRLGGSRWLREVLNREIESAGGVSLIERRVYRETGVRAINQQQKA